VVNTRVCILHVCVCVCRCSAEPFGASFKRTSGEKTKSSGSWQLILKCSLPKNRCVRVCVCVCMSDLLHTPFLTHIHTHSISHTHLYTHTCAYTLTRSLSLTHPLSLPPFLPPSSFLIRIRTRAYTDTEDRVREQSRRMLQPSQCHRFSHAGGGCGASSA
jgi:hypothetical protein